MNQRLRKAKERRSKEQNIRGSVMSTGGHVVKHDRGVVPEIRVPQKATGDVPGDKMAGLAKASPFFEKLLSRIPKSETEEKKIIAEATEDKAAETEEDSKEN